MRATIFDGTQFSDCSVADARAANSSSTVSWIDVRLDSVNDQSADDLFAALGVDMARARASFAEELELGFQITATRIYGVAWLDDNDGSPSQQCLFDWDQHRLVTLRLSGDKAIAMIQPRVLERGKALVQSPSRLLGTVLQMLMATVQRGLTQMAVHVGTLDLEIIETVSPDPSQSALLAQYRKSFQPLALRFPVYLVNVNTALIDPGSVPGLDSDGVAELQQFATDAQNTANIISTVMDGIRNASQDIQAQVSNWQGNRINALTVVTMIFLPISFLTGYFGMNFNWLDDQLNSLGSYLLFGVLVMILVAVGSSMMLLRHGYSFGLKSRRHRAGPARKG